MTEIIHLYRTEVRKSCKLHKIVCCVRCRASAAANKLIHRINILLRNQYNSRQKTVNLSPRHVCMSNSQIFSRTEEQCLVLFQHRHSTDVDIKILNPVNAPSPDPSGRGYPRPIGRIQRYHAVGGANGTTMVVMFVGQLCSGRQYFPYNSYCRNPTGREVFIPARTLVGVKLLKA